MRKLLIVGLLSAVTLTAGCGLSEDQQAIDMNQAKQQMEQVTSQGKDLIDKAKVIGQDLAKVSQQEVANQLQQKLNEQLPQLETNFPNAVSTAKGVSWEALQDTTWVRYSVLAVGDIEFLATVDGHGVAKVSRVNHATGEEVQYAQYQVEYVDGKLVLK